jgi:hypothetical protein
VNDLEKLRVLLPHWLEHNQEHAVEFETWASRAAKAGEGHAAQEIRRAAAAMTSANDALEAALAGLGGDVSPEHEGHTHTHTHPHVHTH